jgi:CubicO group peptidase (beta-lactamase class C family)
VLIDNSAFHPGPGAGPAPLFCGSLHIASVPMQFVPELTHPVVAGRDARLFPGVTLDFFSMDDILVPVQRGRMVGETRDGSSASYWSLIPQFGRIWRQPSDDNGWSRAAFPLMLVNDLENHAHQGLASFLYRGVEVSELRFQFVQQTAPYLLKQHFMSWGSAPAVSTALAISLDTQQREARRELAGRLPTRPWGDLTSHSDLGALDRRGEPLDRLGRPLDPKWIVAAAWVHDGTLYLQDSITPLGAYPYPLEMRFGVRSVMKSIAAPLSLLRLAQLYGQEVLTLMIGHYVPGLDPKFNRVRFIDAANMATGFGGTGTWHTHPNAFEDGYLDADYDGWFTAASHEEKIRHMAKSLRPYPWEPGTVTRYRDQDFYVLGAAIDAFLQSRRGPGSDAWEMLCEEVFEPIGIPAAPAIRTREGAGQRGLAWFNAGYYPSLDDLAKIALLYQRRGEWGGRQILHRELTRELLAAEGALCKSNDSALRGGRLTHYKMGFHFTSHVRGTGGPIQYLPTMCGAGENEVVLYPNGMISIRVAKLTQSAPPPPAFTTAL